MWPVTAHISYKSNMIRAIGAKDLDNPAMESCHWIDFEMYNLGCTIRDGTARNVMTESFLWLKMMDASVPETKEWMNGDPKFEDQMISGLKYTSGQFCGEWVTKPDQTHPC